MSNLIVIKVAILFALFFSLFSGGCSKDESPTEPKRDIALVGTWEIAKFSIESPSETVTYTKSQLNEMGSVWTLEIKDGGTFEQTGNMSESGTLETQTGTWSTSANQLTMTFETGAETGTIVVIVL